MYISEIEYEYDKIENANNMELNDVKAISNVFLLY